MSGFAWYALYLREMLIFKKRLFKLSYVLASMITPIIYLLTFGLGLGRGVEGDNYIAFLLPGLVMMSGMTNSYMWVSGAINIGRLMHKSFQTHLTAPISASSIVIAHIFSGITKGAFGMMLILLVGIFIVKEPLFSLPFLVGALLNLICFSALGVIVGMVVKSHEETATWNNFIITPMGFFAGTFFPLERFPEWIKIIIYCTPLAHANVLARKSCFDEQALWSLVVLGIYCFVFLALANHFIRNYSE